MERIGTVKSIRRYPIKSMAGEDLQEARVTFAGLLGDRIYAFVDENSIRPDFPWLTGRQAHELILFHPRWSGALPTDDSIPRMDQYAIDVRTPDGKEFRVGDENFTRYLEQRFGRSLHLRFSERSMTDARPVSILGLSALHALSQETGIELDPRRFRENFYAEWQDRRPFFEDELVGRELQIGDAVALRVVKRNGRCVMTTLDPDTAQASPQIFERIARAHDGCAGVYGAVLREGVVRMNDPIYLSS